LLQRQNRLESVRAAGKALRPRTFAVRRRTAAERRAGSRC
jgi:hypothetical protein